MKFSAPYTLAFDCGTTGCKGILVDGEGFLVDKVIRKYSSISLKSGYLEQNSMTWWASIKDTTREVMKKNDVKPDELTGIGFCGTMAAALPIDRTGKTLRNAILYADMRATDQCEELVKSFERKYIYNLTGNPLSPVYPLAKWMWIKENEPEVFEKTFKFIQPKDFLVLKSTDEIVTDYVDASATMAFDINKRKWTDELLNFAGIPSDMLPEPQPSMNIAGELTGRAAGELGLKKGLPVVVGSGDTAALLIGARSVEHAYATVYLGAAAEIDLTTDKPLFDPDGRIPVRCHAIPDMWFNSASSVTSGTALTWFVEHLCESGGSRLYEKLDRKALKISPGSGGLVFMPYLSGERVPIWDPKARGAFIGINLSSRRAHFYRAVLEGAAFSLRNIMDTYKKFVSDFRGISMSGGGAESEIWKHIVVDVLGVRCSDLMYPGDAGAIGVATYIGAALEGKNRIVDILDKIVRLKGTILPNEKEKAIYDEFYRIYCKCYPAVAEIMHALVDSQTRFGAR